LGITLTVTVLYGCIPIFIEKRKLKLTKLFFSFVIPLWYIVTLILIGGNFSQSIAVASTLTMSYVFFQYNKKLLYAVFIYNIVVYILAVIFVNVYGPIYPDKNYPFDELVVFIICIYWIFYVIFINEDEKNLLIDELHNKNKNLDATSKELEKFTYIASHDLKTPIRNISSFISLTERNLDKNDIVKARENLTFVKNSANRMYYLLHDILELTTLQNSKIEDFESITINEIIKTVLENNKNYINVNSAVVNYNSAHSYSANKSEMQIIFQNIILNGIKYNKSKIPTINIKTDIIKDNLVIEFKDNGIGIDSQYFKSIFEIFTRLHTYDEYEGTGIGLGISKKIIDKYKGTIKVNSKLGEGSMFTIVLPLISNKKE